MKKYKLNPIELTSDFNKIAEITPEYRLPLLQELKKEHIYLPTDASIHPSEKVAFLPRAIVPVSDLKKSLTLHYYTAKSRGSIRVRVAQLTMFSRSLYAIREDGILYLTSPDVRQTWFYNFNDEAYLLLGLDFYGRICSRQYVPSKEYASFMVGMHQAFVVQLPASTALPDYRQFNLSPAILWTAKKKLKLVFYTVVIPLKRFMKAFKDIYAFCATYSVNCQVDGDLIAFSFMSLPPSTQEDHFLTPLEALGWKDTEDYVLLCESLYTPHPTLMNEHYDRTHPDTRDIPWLDSIITKEGNYVWWVNS